MITTDIIQLAIVNITTITLPLYLIIIKLERRLTKLETEHNIYHKDE